MALVPGNVGGPQSGRSRPPLLMKDILMAQSMTTSAAEAARYLHVSDPTYKKYCMMYNCFKKAGSNRGYPRKKHRGKYGLDSILNGEHPGYDRKKLLHRLIQAGYCEDACALCGFDTARPVDGKKPFMLDFIDGDSNNLSRDNLRVLCYSCIYVTTGKVREPTARLKKEPKYMSSGYQDMDIEDQGITQEELEQIQNEQMLD